MNVLFLDQFSEMGGAQRVLLDTLDAVVAVGWTAHVACPGGGPLVGEIKGRQLPLTEIPCGPYASGHKSRRDMLRFALDLRRQARTIANLTRRIRFDLVYVNGPRLLPAAALSVRGRVLFHAHSNIPERRALKVAHRAIRRVNASVVACSRSVASGFQECVTSEDLHVIPNGVREVRFRERGFRRSGNWRVGMLGRISPEKGQTEFLRAVKLVSSHVTDVQFVICGAPLFGAIEYFETVKRLAQDLPVEFRGWQEDLNSVFDEFDLLAVPSLEEGMGRVIVEAFSAGVPVVAFPTGGIPEVVTDGETGFLTRDCSPEDLATRLIEIITADPENLRRIAAQARCAWERAYRVEVYQKRITDLMLNLVSSRPSSVETGAQPGR